MRGKVVVFPLSGRNWCFSRSFDPAVHDAGAQSSNLPSTFKELCGELFSSSSSRGSASATTNNESKLEMAVDFVANKMNQSWVNLEKAPQGTLKNKIHGLGLKLLSRVKPSEIFFRSLGKEISGVDIVYPSSLNPRRVHRRLRHLAFRGSVVHKKYFYSLATLLPFTSVFMVLPLPNIPFFWILFRTYCHWRASQGSEKLLYFMNEAMISQLEFSKRKECPAHEADQHDGNVSRVPYVLQPSEELQRLMPSTSWNDIDGVSAGSVAEICKAFHLDQAHVFKYGRSVF